MVINPDSHRRDNSRELLARMFMLFACTFTLFRLSLFHFQLLFVQIIRTSRSENEISFGYLAYCSIIYLLLILILWK